MSQSIDFTGTPSAFSTDVNCNTCGRLVEFKPCVSNCNGNKGVLFAIVHSSPAYVIQVLNFKYYSVITLTKTLAKKNAISSIGNQDHLAHPSHTLPIEHTLSGPSLAPSVSIPQVVARCPVPKCGQKCLADDCPCRFCRKHCIEKGGCGSKKHKVSTMTMALAKAYLHRPSHTVRHHFFQPHPFPQLLHCLRWPPSKWWIRPTDPPLILTVQLLLK